MVARLALRSVTDSVRMCEIDSRTFRLEWGQTKGEKRSEVHIILIRFFYEAIKYLNIEAKVNRPHSFEHSFNNIIFASELCSGRPGGRRVRVRQLFCATEFRKDKSIPLRFYFSVISVPRSCFRTVTYNIHWSNSQLKEVLMWEGGGEARVGSEWKKCATFGVLFMRDDKKKKRL